MNVNPLVTVIIPTFKRADKLNRAINSVLSQAYSHIEIIVVDDNNPDSEFRLSTENIMLDFKDKSNVIYVKHDVNKNGAAARNTGLKLAKGAYIFFLDDDDYFLSDKISKQIDFMQQNLDFEASYTRVIRNGKQNNTSYSGRLVKELLLTKTEMYTPTLCFTKSSLQSINGFDEKFKRHQDYEMLLRFFDKNYKIGLLKEPLTVLGQNDGENALTGKKLEDMKRSFLTKFKKNVGSFDSKTQNIIIITHLSTIFLSYIKLLKIKSACRILKECMTISKQQTLSIYWALFARKIFTH